jgi:hypothetical protein
MTACHVSLASYWYHSTGHLTRLGPMASEIHVQTHAPSKKDPNDILRTTMAPKDFHFIQMLLMWEQDR